MSEKTYKIIKQIGKGSFGRVYLCQNLKLKELCVIKRINLSKLDDKEKEETINESKILQKLDHQNIIKFYDVFIEKKSETTLNLVTEYADGGDLSEKIKNQKKNNYFPENEILDYFIQICFALKHIHDKKIIHRDLKSQNIFLTKKGLVKLGDFGVAKNLQYTWKKASTLIGTPYYLSPEIVMNKPYSFKSDIWSLGVLLYEMMSLKMPFDAVSLPMLTLKIMKGDYPPPPSNYSNDLRNLVSLLLNVSDEKRPNINQILRNSFIKDRIKNCLKENQYNKDFSVTIVNNYNLGKIQKKNTFNNKNINNNNNNNNIKNTNINNNSNNDKNINNNGVKNTNTNNNNTNNAKNINVNTNNNNKNQNNNNSKDINPNNSKNIQNNENNNLKKNNNNNINSKTNMNNKNINIKNNINNYNSNNNVNKKDDNKKIESNKNNNNINLSKKDLSKFLNKEEKKENSNNNIKRMINNQKKEEKKDDKPQIKLQIKPEPKSDEKKNNQEKEKNSPQSKIQHQYVHKSYNKDAVKLISPIKKENPVSIKLNMNNNKNKEISNSEQITKRPLSKPKEQKISIQSSNNKNNQNLNKKNNLINNKNINLNKNNNNNNNVKNSNNNENIISERLKSDSNEISKQQRKSLNIKKTPTQKERLKDKDKNQKKIITSPEEDLKKLRELMEKGKKELEKLSISSNNNNFNNYTDNNKANENLNQSKKEHDFINQSHKQFFPNVIFVEKKLELNDEKSNNKNVKIKRMSTNPIDNYLNSFMNNEEKENLKKKKEEEYNYDKNRYFIELDKNANDNNILEENTNEEHNIINNTTFETNNNDIENDKIEIPNDIEIDNKNNEDNSNIIIPNYESDFGKIEELKIQLEKSLGAELFKDIYHIMDETTDLNEIKFDEEKVKNKIKKEWTSNKKYKQNEIDYAVQKIPEIFSIISQERISTFQ